MKNQILRTIFIIFFTLMNINIFSQETVSSYKGGIIAGTSRKFDISFNRQELVRVKILSIDGDQIIIKRINGDKQEIDLNTITNIEEIPSGTIGNVGVGFGIPYGILGFNLELNLLPIISVTGGFGTTIFAGIGYNAGVKGYLRKPGPVWRPRASAYYGINGLYVSDDFEYSEKYSGVSVGLGQLVLWQEHGFDLDFIYLVTSELWDYTDSGGKIKISFGYKYAF